MSEAVAKSDLYCVCCVYGVSSSKQTADSHSQDAATTVAAAVEDDDQVDVVDTTSLWSADEELFGELMSMPYESHASDSDSDSLDDSCSDLNSIDISSINSSDSDSLCEVTQLEDSSFFDCSSIAIADIDYST